MMGARSKSRKRALDILYAAEIHSESPVVALDRLIVEDHAPANPYTEVLVRGVVEHLPRIDGLLSQYSEGWTLDRMPAVDRNVLRMGVFEILYADDLPAPVAVSEALRLVSDLSTDDSPQFVNGILGAITRDREVLLSPRD